LKRSDLRRQKPFVDGLKQLTANCLQFTETCFFYDQAFPILEHMAEAESIQNGHQLTDKWQ